MRTQFPLQPQPLWSTQIIILPLVCHSLLKFPHPPDSKGSKLTSNSVMKSSTSSASLLQSLQDTHTLLINLGYPDTSTTLEVWADQLLNFHECYLQGNLPETIQGTLGIDANLQNELHVLVEEIHTSPNPHPFKDPLDPSHSFHVQCKELVGT
ncbi:hypothetical protein C0989_004957 [Termitomyces sp. Mn162]|nr:hypothetical protein C0989_004957 [Termitomyces sp. Mn162]